MIETDRYAFNEWFKSFIKRRRGLKPIADWFDIAEREHQPIREYLGGVRKTLCVELENSQARVPFSQINGITAELLSIIPEYFYDGQINRSMFQTPSILDGEFAGMKRGRHIKHWMSKKKINDEVQNRVNVIMSNLGKTWAQSKTNKRKLYITLTTDPRAFVQLGCYGPDHQSCFKQGGCNQSHKYVLGSNKGTYVVLVGSSQDLEYQNTDDVIARFWGIANDSYDIWSVANYYPKPGEKEGDIFNCVDKLFAEVLQVEKAGRHESGLTVEPVYQNKVVNWCYTRPDFRYEGFYAALKWNGLDDTSYCHKCNTVVLRSVAHIIDGYRLCDHCEENLNVCEYTKKKTLSELTPAINADGTEIKIGNGAINEGHFRYCTLACKYYHSSLLVKSGTYGYISKQVAIERGYKECNKCKVYFHWKDTEDDNCRWCIRKEVINKYRAKKKYSSVYFDYEEFSAY
jgi:hypothetical protein